MKKPHLYSDTLGAGLLLGLSGCDLYPARCRSSPPRLPSLRELQAEVDEAHCRIMVEEPGAAAMLPAGGAAAPHFPPVTDGDEEQSRCLLPWRR